jgi:hypothetical protein
LDIELDTLKCSNSPSAEAKQELIDNIVGGLTSVKEDVQNAKTELI